MMPLGLFMVDKMSFGDNLKRLRRDKGWTQGELAKVSGIKWTHIPRLEKEGADPKLSTIYRLAEALNCSFDTLLMDSEKVSMGGLAKASMERLGELSETEQYMIIDLIDALTTRKALEASFGDKQGMKLMLWKDKPERLYNRDEKEEKSHP